MSLLAGFIHCCSKIAGRFYEEGFEMVEDFPNTERNEDVR